MVEDPQGQVSTKTQAMSPSLCLVGSSLPLLGAEMQQAVPPPVHPLDSCPGQAMCLQPQGTHVKSHPILKKSRGSQEDTRTC